MKKEYLILILIIAVLTGYLVLNKKDRRHYTLPDPPAVDTKKIDRLTVEKTDQTLDFIRTESGWVVTKQSYPADSAAVKQMLTVISDLTLSALVSEKQDVIRYELDDTHRLAVTAFEGETPVLSFKIGKPASTYNHTFVMLENDPNIYQANDSFRSHFNKSLDEFRDRRVLTFQEAHIKAITIQTPEKEVVLTAREPAGDDTPDTEPVFNYQDGTSADPKTVSDLLDSLSDLTCDRFLPDTKKTDMESSSPILTILLENDATRVLKLFEQNGDDPMPATSSMNDHAFLLKNHVAEDITSYAHDLAGLTPEQTEHPATP
ncbi:MAG: DUF4340 domain-containing protein [Desulfotignum sp.]